MSGGGGVSVPKTYQPAAQGTADINWNQIIGGLESQNAAGNSPGQLFAPTATNIGMTAANNPFAAQQQIGAQVGAQQYGGLTDTFLPQVEGLGTAANNNPYAPLAQSAALGGAQQTGNLIGGYLPNVEALGQLYGQNPGAPLMNFGAQQGASIADQGVQQAFPNISSVSHTVPQLTGAASQTLDTAFDPQQALFNRTQGQLIDQSNVANAMAGIGSSPYGASNTANALGNFDINWQNNLLNRQATGLGAAGAADTQAAGNTASALGDSANALNLYTGGLSLPYNTYNTQLNNQLGGLTNAANTAQGLIGAGVQSGQQPYNTLQNQIVNALSGIGSATGQGSNLINAGVTGAGLPYGTENTQLANALSQINNAIGAGNQQYALPTQLLGNLQSYMQLGQSASNIGSGVNAQNLSNISGIGQGIGNLLGGSGLLSGATDALGIGADVGGGGDFLGSAASALPLAGS